MLKTVTEIIKVSSNIPRMSATDSNLQAGIKPLLRKFLSGLEREPNRVLVRLQAP